MKAITHMWKIPRFELTADQRTATIGESFPHRAPLLVERDPISFDRGNDVARVFNVFRIPARIVQSFGQVKDDVREGLVTLLISIGHSVIFLANIRSITGSAGESGASSIR